MAVSSSHDWPGMTTRYAWLSAHEEESHTGAGQVGVAFTEHRDVAYRSHGTTRRASYPAGSVICSGDAPIVWSQVRGPTEALEIYPDPSLLAGLGAFAHGAAAWPSTPCRVGLVDPVVLSVATELRRAHVTDHHVSDVRASTLAHLVARHVLERYAGHRLARPGRPTRLPSWAVDRVHALVDAELGGTLTLDRLAAEVHLSPYHFARSFRATVGAAPHAFVTQLRMNRARTMLTTTGLPVEEVARAVGFTNSSHFRRVFRAHTGTAPGRYRDATR